MMEVIRFINDFTGLIHLVGLLVFITFTVAVVHRLNKIANGVLVCEDHLEVLRYEDYGGRIDALARLVDNAFEYYRTVCNTNGRRAEEDMKKELEILEKLNDTVNLRGYMLRDTVSENFAVHSNASLKELRGIRKLLKKEAKNNK